MKPLRYHPLVQRDINEAMRYYREVSEAVADGFWKELFENLEEIKDKPEANHFDISGLRRRI